MAKKQPPPSGGSPFSAALQGSEGGFNSRNIVVAIMLLAMMVGGAYYLLSRGWPEMPEMPETSGPKSSGMTTKPKTYADAPPPPPIVPAALPVVEPISRDEPRSISPAARAEGPKGDKPKPDELMEAARKSEIARIEPAEDRRRSQPTEKAAKLETAMGNQLAQLGEEDGTEFGPTATCQVNAGTPVQINLLSSPSTAHGGSVIAEVKRTVFANDDFECEAIPFGSRFYGEVRQAEMRGQKVAILLFSKLTRAAPRNDTILLTASASDQMGRNGAPGELVSHFWSQAALILAATAVDLTTAVISSGEGIGGIIGGIAMSNANRPLNKAATDRLNIPPTIEVDALEHGGNLTVILQQDINADDHRRS